MGTVPCIARVEASAKNALVISLGQNECHSTITTTPTSVDGDGFLQFYVQSTNIANQTNGDSTLNTETGIVTLGQQAVFKPSKDTVA